MDQFTYKPLNQPRRNQPPVQPPLSPMTLAWSEGKTVFPIRTPQPRLIEKDPAEMTLDELIATQDQELPTISYTAWQLTGDGALSINRPHPDTGSTIADMLPAEHPMQTAWQTVKPVTDMTPDEIRALDRWYAEHTRHTGMTPYRTLHPAKRRQIQWEQDTARSGQEHSARMLRNHSGVPQVILRPSAPDADTYTKLAKDYLRFLRDHIHGHVPTMDEIEAQQAEIHEIRASVGIPKHDDGGWYHSAYLMTDETDPYRWEQFDAELHSSYEYLAEPDPFDEDFVASYGLDPEDVRDEQPRTTLIRFRSVRDLMRYRHNPNHNDALWHARLGQALDLGTHDEQPRTFGRVVRDAVDQLWAKVNNADTTIDALSTLTD